MQGAQKHPTITEQTIVGIYLRYLPSGLGLQAREKAADKDLGTLYSAAKFAATREDRRNILPPPQDAMGFATETGTTEGRFAMEGFLAGATSVATTPGGGFSRAAATASSLEVLREVANPRTPPHNYPQARDGPAGRWRRNSYAADPRSAPPGSADCVPERMRGPRWSAAARGLHGVTQREFRGPGPRVSRRPQVNHVGESPSQGYSAPELRSADYPSQNYRTPTPETVAGPPTVPQPVPGSGGWNPCFVCGRACHGIMNCTKYLQ